MSLKGKWVETRNGDIFDIIDDDGVSPFLIGAKVHYNNRKKVSKDKFSMLIARGDILDDEYSYNTNLSNAIEAERSELNGN